VKYNKETNKFDISSAMIKRLKAVIGGYQIYCNEGKKSYPKDKMFSHCFE
jgi:hypothetical protein